MNNNFKKSVLAGCVILGASFSGLALATGGGSSKNCGSGGGGGSNPDCYTWTFNDSSASLQTSNTENSSPSGVTATATAWSSTGTGGALQSAYIGEYGSSGMGVTNNTGIDAASPQHAVDNSGAVDSVLFSFGSKVNVDSMTVGWVSGDSDYTVLAYTGTGTPAALAGQTYAALLGNGWSLVGNYSGGSSAGSRDFVNDIYSSYWLIGALNTLVGGVQDSTSTQVCTKYYTGTNTCKTWGTQTTPSYDYFKLLSLAGCDCSTAPAGTPGCGGGGNPGGGVPEPGTIFLLGAGLLGLTRMVRRPAR